MICATEDIQARHACSVGLDIQHLSAPSQKYLILNFQEPRPKWISLGIVKLLTLWIKVLGDNVYFHLTPPPTFKVVCSTVKCRREIVLAIRAGLHQGILFPFILVNVLCTFYPLHTLSKTLTSECLFWAHKAVQVVLPQQETCFLLKSCQLLAAKLKQKNKYCILMDACQKT